MSRDAMIVTGASSAYGPALLALLGSLKLNWHGHPEVLVYDLGLDEDTRSALRRHRVNTRVVPPFCPHWRRHFTWKIWAWNDAPAEKILWMDAGIVALRPLPEIFDTISRLGYFLVPNGMPLAREASEAACRGCGVSPDFRLGKGTLCGGFAGFRKDIMGALLEEMLSVALTEEHIAASEPGHRHDQALLSLLAYRDFQPLQTADPEVYLMDRSPRERPGQPVWCHRRAIRPRDGRHFADRISAGGAPFLPSVPSRWRWPGKRYAPVVYDGVRD
jgi:hypothetical protein